MAIEHIRSPEPLPLEKIILAEIRDRTGFTFKRIGGIDTRDKEIAEAVLPVLAEWINKVSDHLYRRALYARFHTPYALPYFDRLVSWWVNEQDEIASGNLTQDLALLIECEDAARIWRFCQDLPPKPFHYMLVSKLARCASVALEVKKALVEALNTESLRAADLSYIAQVDDPRIRRWFERRTDSTDPNISLIAKRVIGRRKKLSNSVEYANVAPDRRAELYSTEEDVQNVKCVLEKLAKDFNLKIPAAVKSGAFLSSIGLDRWVAAHISGSSDGKPVTISFRLEDTDTVEIVLSRP
jgi:hypothetical protein